MGVQNDGYKIYSLLVEYSTATGLPTGRTKPNLPGDPNYIAPVSDPASCPIGSVDPTMIIVVEIPFGFVAEYKVLYGLSELVRTTSGNWTVPERTYDNVIFNITNYGASANYKVRVTYNNGQIAEADVSGVTQIFMPGPFSKITRMEIIPALVLGSFSDSYSDSFDN